jgi:decaprenylphospho-beta-D-ribofuranose 2-oxidase
MRAERLAAPVATLEGYGMRQRARSRVARLQTVEEIAEVFAAARAEGVSVGLRGGGNSYGDAALNGDAIVLDTSRMNRILAWDPQSGIITCEPGVTIAQLWRATLADGWWPPVIPGTMAVTGLLHRAHATDAAHLFRAGGHAPDRAPLPGSAAHGAGRWL